MKTAIRIFCLLLLLPGARSAQAQFKTNIACYYDLLNASYRANREGKADSAIHYARAAIRLDTANNKPCRYLGNLLIARGRYKEGLALLRQDILMGSTPPEKPEYLFDHYDSVKGRPEIRQFVARLPVLVKEYYATSYNHAFAALIYKMLGRDQAIRGGWDQAYGNDSVKARVTAQVQAFLDTAMNMREIVAYLKTAGFPAYREMDDALSSSFHVILHHLIAFYDGPLYNELDALVRSAVYEGRYSPYAYMLALDWRAINKTGKQLYGTYIGPGPDGVTTFAPPIDNVAGVDARRAAWKQGPLKDVPFSDWRNPKLPADYKP